MAHHRIPTPAAAVAVFIANLRALDSAGMIRLVARYDGQHGIFDVAELAGIVPDLEERTTLACGPAGLLDALEEHHAERGLELLTERFRLAKPVVGEGGTVSFARTRSSRPARSRP